MSVPQDALTAATKTFQTGFIGIQNDFLGYGQSIFYYLLLIAIVLRGLEYMAKGDIGSNLPEWTRELLIAMFFYTLMLNLPWLSSLPNSATKIGLGYLGTVDPSSIVVQGVNVENKILDPILNAGLLDAGAAMIVGIIASVVVAFCMINIAINVALTLIITQALISISPLFLAAGAFRPSVQVARNLIDAIIGNTVKLIGYYIVIYVGNKSITTVMGQIDGTFSATSSSVDQYGYIIAVVALYYAAAKTLPEQLAKLVSGVVQENRGTEIGAAAMAMQKMATSLAPLASQAARMSAGGVSIAGSTLANAMANYRQISSSQGGGIGAATKATASALGNLAKSTGGSVADKFRSISQSGVTTRMQQATRTANATSKE